MGYTTKFTGQISLSRQLTMSEAKALLDIHDNPDLASPGCPDSYLRWVPTDDLMGIVWDEGEKFYHYVEWMCWICDHLTNLGITANGSLVWQGEETGDTGTLTVTNSQVNVSKGAIPPKGKARPLTLDRLARLALALEKATGGK
jgi:hypothetical protein